MPKSVTYVGPYGPATDPDTGDVLPGVRIPVDDVGNLVWASSGDTVELPDHIADELVERGEFVHASAASDTGAPPHAATKAEWEAFRAAQGHEVDGLTKDQLMALPDTAPSQEA